MNTSEGCFSLDDREEYYLRDKYSNAVLETTILAHLRLALVAASAVACSRVVVSYCYAPVLVAVVGGLARYRTQLLAVAAEHLRVEDVLAAAAVAERLHHAVDLALKHLRQLQHVARRTSNSVESGINEDLTSVPARHISKGAAPCPYCLAPCPIIQRPARNIKKIKKLFTQCNSCCCVFRQPMYKCL